jgi:hypothetical protein
MERFLLFLGDPKARAFRESLRISSFLPNDLWPLPLMSDRSPTHVLRVVGPGNDLALHATPEDVHSISRNASKTKPAKFVVFFIKDEGAPILASVPQLRTRVMYFPDETFFPKAIFLMWRQWRLQTRT